MKGVAEYLQPVARRVAAGIRYLPRPGDGLTFEARGRLRPASKSVRQARMRESGAGECRWYREAELSPYRGESSFYLTASPVSATWTRHTMIKLGRAMMGKKLANRRHRERPLG